MCAGKEATFGIAVCRAGTGGGGLTVKIKKTFVKATFFLQVFTNAPYFVELPPFGCEKR